MTRLDVRSTAAHGHADLAGACCWTSSRDLYTAADDGSLSKWSIKGDRAQEVSSVLALSAVPERVHECAHIDIKAPSVGRPRGLFISRRYVKTILAGSVQIQAPTASSRAQHVTCMHAPTTSSVPHPIATGCADGCLRLLTPSGKLERATDAAHAGAITHVRWNHSGSELATGGEDGTVRTWSALGIVRATVAHGETPVYALAWSPDSASVRCSVPAPQPLSPSCALDSCLLLARSAPRWEAAPAEWQCEVTPVADLPSPAFGST